MFWTYYCPNTNLSLLNNLVTKNTNNPVTARLVIIENVNNNVTLGAFANKAEILTDKLRTGTNANPVDVNPKIDGINDITMNSIVHGPK